MYVLVHRLAHAPGLTALHYAARRGDVEIVKMLLANGADVNIIHSHKSTALMNVVGQSTVDQRHVDIAKLLIKNGVDVNAVDEYESTALTSTAFVGHGCRKGVGLFWSLQRLKSRSHPLTILTHRRGRRTLTPAPCSSSSGCGATSATTGTSRTAIGPAPDLGELHFEGRGVFGEGVH